MTDHTPAREQAMPTDWKLVPVEPTHEMLNHPRVDAGERTMRRAWTAMLEAAPAPAPACGGVDAVLLTAAKEFLVATQGRVSASFVEAAYDPTDWRRTERDLISAIEAASLSLATTPVSEAEPGEQCERCQGNGEIVTDWDRYLHGEPEDKGDQGTTECPDCNGTGRVDAEPVSEAEPAGILLDGGWRTKHDDLLRANGILQSQLRECQEARRQTLAKPASSAAGGDVREALRDLLDVAEAMAIAANLGMADEAIYRARRALAAAAPAAVESAQ